MSDIIVKDIWIDDKLGRQEDAELIRRFILGQLDLRQGMGKPRTFVLNLDSQWGGGKTFFLERFKFHLEKNEHICVSVNAWEDDHSDDPLIAVVSAINEVLRDVLPQKGRAEKLKPLTQNTGKIVTSTIGMALKQLLKKGLGDEGPEALLAIIAEGAIDAVSADVLATFEDQKATITSFRDSLENLTESALDVGSIKAPVFVLIDELDRCRPDYAIKLLERVKHLFSVENIVFVVATDTGQLSKAIAGAYGPEFDGTRYLKRFFDRTYYFPEVTTKNLIEATFDELGFKKEIFIAPLKMDPIHFLSLLCSIKGVEPRDIKQLLSMLETFVSVWEHPNIPINLVVLFPLLYQLHEHGTTDPDVRNGMHNIVIKSDYWNGQKTVQVDTDVSTFVRLLTNYTDQNLNAVYHKFKTRGIPPADKWALDIIENERGGINMPMPIPLQNYAELISKLSNFVVNSDNKPDE